MPGGCEVGEVRSRPWQRKLVLVEQYMVSSALRMGEVVERIDEGQTTYQRARVFRVCYNLTLIFSGITSVWWYKILQALQQQVC